ncbi:hypothetical protein RI129_004536 [Pyrocoelia pectoralis]|uniref:RING-type domain-containing protein n=1 Tax=Pyrocoelia pectoralis TaxID=417401 RepID=A0AAN7ZKL7_9COLE
MPNADIPNFGWREFEDIIQCNICMDILQSPPGSMVEQCVHGHHICANCRVRVDNCPTCKCAYIGTRNFVVEELVRNYEILRNIINLADPLSENIKETKVELNAAAPAFNPRITKRRKVDTPQPPKGIYPCRVDQCNVKLPAGRLLNHVRSFHADKLTESILDANDTYTHDWVLTFNKSKPINTTSFVLFVSGIGTVFLTIEILRTGHLIAVLRANMKYAQARTFVGSLEFYSQERSYSHSVLLVSVKDNIEHMILRKNCFLLTKNQLRILCVDRKFNCKLKLSHFNAMVPLPEAAPNLEQISVVAVIRKSLCEEEKKKFVKTGEQFQDKKGKKGVSNDSQPQCSSTSSVIIQKDKKKVNKDLLNDSQPQPSASSSEVVPKDKKKVKKDDVLNDAQPQSSAVSSQIPNKDKKNVKQEQAEVLNDTQPQSSAASSEIVNKGKRKVKKGNALNDTQPQASTCPTDKLIREILETIRNNDDLITELSQNNSNTVHNNPAPSPPPARRRRHRRNK